MSILDVATSRILDEAEWLETRRRSLGASDVAAALGLSPYANATPIDKWQEKLGIAPPTPENEAMYWGKVLEPVVQAEYEKRAGVTLVAQQFVRHPEYPWLTATIDGLTPDGKVVQIKTAGAHAQGWGDDGDEVPLQYIAQVHQEMMIVGATEADIPVLIGGQRFRIFTVKFDATLAHNLLVGARRFWRCVESRTPPDWGRLDAKALAVLHPNCAGTIELDADTQSAVALYQDYGQQIDFAEKQREACKMQILAAMGDAQDGLLPDGRKVRRYLQDVEERTQVVNAHQKHYFKVLKGGAK